MDENILVPGSKSAIFFFFFFLRVFRSLVLQNYFRVFLLALFFEIMQDICRRPVNASFIEIQNWYLILSPPYKDGRLARKLVRRPMLFFCFFSPKLMYLSSGKKLRTWYFFLKFDPTFLT